MIIRATGGIVSHINFKVSARVAVDIGGFDRGVVLHLVGKTVQEYGETALMQLTHNKGDPAKLRFSFYDIKKATMTFFYEP